MYQLPKSNPWLMAKDFEMGIPEMNVVEILTESPGLPSYSCTSLGSITSVSGTNKPYEIKQNYTTTS